MDTKQKITALGRATGVTRRRRRRAATWAAASASALALLLSGCAGGSSLGGGGDDNSSSSANGPIKIGFIATLSGTEAPSGKDMVNGFKLYLAEHDNKLGGRDVELTVADGGGSPSAGLAAAQKLITQNHVDILAGVTISPVALAIRDLVTNSKVPLVISNAGANALTGKEASPYIWRVSFANCQPDYAMAKYIKSKVGDGGVYVIGRDDAAGHEHTQGFVDGFKDAGGTIAGSAYPPFGTTQNYQPYLSRIQQSGAKATFAFFAGGEAVKFVKQYQKFGLKDSIPLYAAGYLTADGHIINAEGQAAVGLQTSLNYSPHLDNPTNTKFVADYQKKYGEVPNLYSAQSWDAGTFISKGLEASKGKTGTALLDAWKNLGSFDSPRGTVKMDSSQNAVQTWYVLEAAKNGDTYENTVVKSLGTVTHTCG